MSDAGFAVSVVVVSDYGGGSSEGWDYLRDALRALGRQAFDGRVEVILVDSTPVGQQMPADVVDLVPALRVIGCATKSRSAGLHLQRIGVDEPPMETGGSDGCAGGAEPIGARSAHGGKFPQETTRELLNTAVGAASADLVVLLDGDCVPAPGWLRAAVDAMRAHPDAAAVSGLTVYPDTGFTYRALATLSRSFVDPGRPGLTRFITSNNAIFRRSVLLAHPLTAFTRVLAERLQVEAIRLAGGALYFEPGMRVTHRFDGWPMERRIRRNVGYRVVRVRQVDPRAPHAWMLRLGIFSIPVILAARTLDSWCDCVRSGRHYGLRWFELPAAFATAVVVHLLEIDGMRAAISGKEKLATDEHR